MDSPTTSAEAADASEFPPLFPDELWYEVLLRYGLYVGAAFQLVCILAVIVLPPIKEGSDSSAGVCKIFYHKCKISIVTVLKNSCKQKRYRLH